MESLELKFDLEIHTFLNSKRHKRCKRRFANVTCDVDVHARTDAV